MKAKAHSGPCTNPQRTQLKFGSYCGRCHHSYLCTRCGANAVPGNVREAVCGKCIQRQAHWCQCPGCGDEDTAHALHMCKAFRDTMIKNVHSFCRACSGRWSCKSCGKDVFKCAARPRSDTCQECLTKKDVEEVKLCISCDWAERPDVKPSEFCLGCLLQDKHWCLCPRHNQELYH